MSEGASEDREEAGGGEREAWVGGRELQVWLPGQLRKEAASTKNLLNF